MMLGNITVVYKISVTCVTLILATIKGLSVKVDSLAEIWAVDHLVPDSGLKKRGG